MENQIHECCSSHKKIFPLVSVLFIVLIIFLLISSYTALKGKGTNNQTITISESADVYSKPDIASMDFSVITDASSVSEAMNQNSSKMNGVIEALKALGIDEKDIKTTNFSIYPRYDYYDKPMSSISGQRVLAGYEATQTLSVKIKDFTKISSVIQKATENGANQVGNLSLDIENKDELLKTAREEAINKAKAKAKDLEKELGIKLGKIAGFSESSNNPVYYDSAIKGMGIGGAASAPQVETGQNKLTATVSITYQVE